MRCKHPFKKSISSVCWPIFRSNSAIRPSAQRRCPWPGKTLPGPCRNSRRQRCSTLGLTSNPRATSVIETPASSRRTAANLNSRVNCLRDNPMTQSSIHWILSLNQLSHFWGQVHIQLKYLFHVRSRSHFLSRGETSRFISVINRDGERQQSQRCHTTHNRKRLSV